MKSIMTRYAASLCLIGFIFAGSSAADSALVRDAETLLYAAPMVYGSRALLLSFHLCEDLAQ